MPTYFEDLEEGDEFEYGEYTVSREEILEFANQYDPQPIHTDEEAAKDSMFGGLIASGIHTLGVATRLTALEFFDHVPNMGGSGLDTVRWHQPVYPGDELSVRMTVESKSEPDPDRSGGKVTFRQETLNQDGEVILSLETHQIIEREGAE